MRRKAHSANVPLDPVLIGLRKSCFSRIVIAKERVARLRQSGDITVTKLFKQVGGFTKSLITGSNGTLVALVSLHKKTARPEWTRFFHYETKIERFWLRQSFVARQQRRKV